jgi:hypothetical protein
MAGNRIYYQYNCECTKEGETVKVRINEGQNLKGSEPIYFTCTNCNISIAVEPDLVLPEGRIVSREEKDRLDSVEEYDMGKIFIVGQTIFHPAFDDKGVIVSKREASGYGGKIVVDFEKRGKVNLVEGYENGNKAK